MKSLFTALVLVLGTVIFTSAGPPGVFDDVKQEISFLISDEVLFSADGIQVSGQVYVNTPVVEAEPVTVQGDESLTMLDIAENKDSYSANDAEIVEPVFLRGNSPPGRWRQDAFKEDNKLLSGHNSKLSNPPPAIVFRT